MYWFIVIVTSIVMCYCDGNNKNFYYSAAVVEYCPVNDVDSPMDTIFKNLDAYRHFIEKAHSQNVEIIVFPEYGLTTLVDDPQGYAIDFSNNSRVLQTLSNLAKEFSVYLVVNLLEEVKDGNKTLYFNTDLVYDRKGQIIAKYRKINLFAEPKLTRGNETVTFSTDFGITFGIFTCMDILYGKPSRSILLNKDVTDIIFPTAWYSTMPFYTALTVQHGYSTATGVNLLAANYCEPKKGHGGSGIYLANGSIAEIFIDDISSSKIIVHNVTKINKRKLPTCWLHMTSHNFLGQRLKDMNDYLTYRDFIAKDYTFKDLDLSQSEFLTTLCHGNFCCNFSINVEQPTNSTEIYKLMAYDGEVIYDQSPAFIRVCSLVACENGTNDSCGARISGRTKFTKIAVNGILQKNDNTFYTPLTLNNNLRPIPQNTYCDFPGDNVTYVRIVTLQPVQGVLVFGIFGRVE